MTFLHNVAVSNFRGIGATPVRITKMRKFNFFIGTNNAGKSTMLRLVWAYLSKGNEGKNIDFSDVPQMHDGSPTRISLGLSVEQVETNAQQIGEKLRLASPGIDNAVGIIAQAISLDGVVWFSRHIGERGWSIDRPSRLDMGHPLSHALNAITRNVANVINADQADSLNIALEQITRLMPLELPRASIIPAFRQIRAGDQGDVDKSGMALINRLAQLQNPTAAQSGDMETFRKINAFVAAVTGDVDARIEIPHDRLTVTVFMDGRYLPLENLGTGIHQVILIAAYCTATHQEILCIEEPELHLHPMLQRKLITYLNSETDNQYLIATHSPVFIDTPGAAIFHVRLDEGTTKISAAEIDKHRYDICAELGYRASDIIQTNAVIWVEGPSDRIYLKHWLRAVDDRLHEGAHFTIMHYGGRLLSHLTVDDEEVDEFINLRDLNRNVAIVIDSDIDASGMPLRSSKQRVIGELAKDRGVAWVTQGREIENYIAFDKLQAVVKLTHPDLYVEPATAGGEFDAALNFIAKAKRGGEDKPRIMTADKVRVARSICQLAADLTPLDLRARLEEIVAMIQGANGLAPR